MNTNILHRILSQPWAIQPEVFASLTQQVLQHPAEKDPAKCADIAASLAPNYVPLNRDGVLAAAFLPLPAVPANTTVIMPWGVLGRGWDMWERDAYGAIDTDEMIAAAEQATTDNVVLWFRSPGGISTGIQEAAAALRDLVKSKQVLAFTDTLCASAAYWLAAQCSAIHSTPTAALGSIGVYISFYDFTGYIEKCGIKLELFKAGRLKAMGLAGNPLDEEAREFLQARVAETYSRFVADVTRNRDIDAETMQGQTFSDSAAISRNLSDKHWPSAARFFTALGKGRVRSPI